MQNIILYYIKHNGKYTPNYYKKNYLIKTLVLFQYEKILTKKKKTIKYI